MVVSPGPVADRARLRLIAFVVFAGFHRSEMSGRRMGPHQLRGGQRRGLPQRHEVRGSRDRVLNNNNRKPCFRYIEVQHQTKPDLKFWFTVTFVKKPPPRGCIAFSVKQREWAQLSVNQPISITSYPSIAPLDLLCSIEAEIDYFQANKCVGPTNTRASRS